MLDLLTAGAIALFQGAVTLTAGETRPIRSMENHCRRALGERVLPRAGHPPKAAEHS